MAAHKGNNYAMKWKTPKERKAACGAVCKHLSQGLSQDCFVEADWDTVERYAKDFPKDFPTEKLKEARRKGMLFWESMGIKGMAGKIAFFNSTTWIFNMKNRYGWNDNKSIEISGGLEIHRITDNIPKTKPKEK